MLLSEMVSKLVILVESYAVPTHMAWGVDTNRVSIITSAIWGQLRERT